MQSNAYHRNLITIPIKAASQVKNYLPCLESELQQQFVFEVWHAKIVPQHIEKIKQDEGRERNHNILPCNVSAYRLCANCYSYPTTGKQELHYLRQDLLERQDTIE